MVRCMRPRDSTEFLLPADIPLISSEDLDACTNDLESIDSARLELQPCRAVLAHYNSLAAMNTRFKADMIQTCQWRHEAINFVLAGRLQAMTKLQPQCCACANTERLMRCGGCNLIQYCSVKCRNEDWKHHKELVQLSDVGHVKYLAATWLLLYVSLMGTLLCLSVFAAILMHLWR